MSQMIKERLYNLLPAIYRLRDASQGDPLRALLAIIEDEFLAIQADMDQLYDNWFIETCDEWLVPYIGDLLKVRGIHSLGKSIFSQRTYVANTLAYRRRKGTATVLEQLARDVTGWHARAVEFFKLLATTQHLNHIRLDNRQTPNFRNVNQLGLVNTPFDQASHMLEVRRIATNLGKYNIPNIGLFLWRLQPYFIEHANARAVSNPDDGRYTFNPLGIDAPLFNNPVTETAITHLAEEINVPGRLRWRPLYEELEARRNGAIVDNKEAYFGDQPVFQIFVKSDVGADLKEFLPKDIFICDLSDLPNNETEWKRPTELKKEGETIQVSIDPELGRIVFPEEYVPYEVHVSYSYGFSSNIGGGPYDRTQSVAKDIQADWNKTVSQLDPLADFKTLKEALDALEVWIASNDGNRANAIITILDSNTYTESLNIELADNNWLTIQAENGVRPHLQLSEPMILINDHPGAALTLDGLLIEGTIQVEVILEKLTITHCTVVPERFFNENGTLLESNQPSLTVASKCEQLHLDISNSIVGSLILPAEMAGLTVRDSIIDAPSGNNCATHIPALVSGSLPLLLGLSSTSPAVDIKIGNEGPYRANFLQVPNKLGDAREQLEAAIRAAHNSPAFQQARVVRKTNRLIVLPGVPAAITIEATDTDPTAAELHLDSASALQVYALISGVVPAALSLRSSSPQLNVTIGSEGPHIAMITTVPKQASKLSDYLQKAIRAASNKRAFKSAIVVYNDHRFIILPGVSGAKVKFSTTPTDTTTLTDLALALDGRLPAIAASEDGEQPGPPTILERVTVFGEVYIKELKLASKVIFTNPVRVEKQQIGCVRFSYMPLGSQTPRRYRCQPDLALKNKKDPNERQQLEARLKPLFTSRRYGDPGYAQLSQRCAIEIRTGAEDESEMGVFMDLKQPQRKANLQVSLNEYLRFGLEAGIFYFT